MFKGGGIPGSQHQQQPHHLQQQLHHIHPQQLPLAVPSSIAPGTACGSATPSTSGSVMTSASVPTSASTSAFSQTLLMDIHSHQFPASAAFSPCVQLAPPPPPPPPPLLPPPQSNQLTTTFSVLMSNNGGERLGHCPQAREGPALGCNFCWNTTDSNGRILRRKTKYHCPDCQANLCIVPCFQSYHEALDKEKAESRAAVAVSAPGPPVAPSPSTTPSSMA